MCTGSRCAAETRCTSITGYGSMTTVTTATEGKTVEHITRRLFSWASILEPQAREQAERTASMPFIWPHLALMPDAHQGKGATVGSVIPTLGALMPAAVGVDIGCGMLAVRTQFTIADVRRIGNTASLREAIEGAIPLSAGKYNEVVWCDETRERITELEGRDGVASAESVAPNWRLQLGSLGSGNHFIEVSLDEYDRVWLFLHSGSRGVGNKLAVKHIKIAQELCRRWWIPLPDPDLAYLTEGTDEFWAYIRDLRWAQHFALLNRREMMHRVMSCVDRWAGKATQGLEVIQCHHNYTEELPAELARYWKLASQKEHRGHVWLSRKGAIDATAGKPGLIPGSMGTASYVVEGRGNPLSLNSSPHGAGRNYSRSAARKTFTRDQLDAAMEGIEWGRSDAFLDEIPAAYKPIDQVMADAADLVEIRHTLRQIVNVKGD
jgi:tRNA-splicing ligase RtcB (3'-phosphate/5'-hydroxy nucleic acid ligase)